MELDLLLAAGPLAVALWLRPWRLVGPQGPPWIWLAWCALMPLLWGTDRYVGMSVVQPLSGAVMLLMMTGWPLAMLALVPVTLLTWAMAGLDAAEALHGATPGLDPDEQMIGRWLAAWGDAFLVGMLVAIFVAFRPHWLATYSDRLYLRPPPDEPPPR